MLRDEPKRSWVSCRTVPRIFLKLCSKFSRDAADGAVMAHKDSYHVRNAISWTNLFFTASHFNGWSQEAVFNISLELSRICCLNSRTGKLLLHVEISTIHLPPYSTICISAYKPHCKNFYNSPRKMHNLLCLAASEDCLRASLIRYLTSEVREIVSGVLWCHKAYLNRRQRSKKLSK